MRGGGSGQLPKIGAVEEKLAEICVAGILITKIYEADLFRHDAWFF